MTTLEISQYLDVIDEAHENRGGISGQRDVLRTTTAKRIRTRMVSDIRNGAILPPLVVGAVVDDKMFDGMPFGKAVSLGDIFGSDTPELSIIDGMQRTAAILEACKADPTVRDKKVRVEFWFAKSVRALIYRMLVLNTGQVPWTMARQLTIVYGPLLDEIRTNVPEIDKVATPDNPGRRVGAAQYSSEDIVELYIAFSLRKTAVDTKEAVSDEFSRLDFVDNLSDEEFQTQFYGSLSMLALLDKAFSHYSPDDSTEKHTKGRNIFDAQPARIGFIVAVGVSVLGRPGADRSPEERSIRLEQTQSEVDNLIRHLNKMQPVELGDFLRLDVLREVLDRRVGQIGRYERSVFSEAFKVLVDEHFVVGNLEQCWRAN